MWLHTTWRIIWHPHVLAQRSLTQLFQQESISKTNTAFIRRSLDRITPKENLEKVNEFCASWNVNTDEFWTHNPEWEISMENDTHYCFQRLPSQKEDLFRSIYKSQFETDCTTSIAKKMWNSGWGADLSNLVDGLRFAHQHNKPFEITNDDLGWQYAAKKDGTKPVCPSKSIHCYFLTTTSCNTHRRPINSRQTFLIGSWQGFQKNRDYMEYLTRPQTWLRKKVYDFTKSYQLESPCTVVHVRRGDVVLLDPTPRKYHAIEEYMQEAYNVTKNILLLTDDHNAIGEALHKYPQHKWVYLNRTRYRGPEGGWEEHIPSDRPELEVIALLSAFRLAKQCDKLIHSKSNLADYIFAEMKSRHAKVKKINLDQGQKNVHHADNAQSVRLSKAYS